MDNYKDISFYPHYGPSKYSYTSAFGDANNREKTAEQAKVNTAYSGFSKQGGNAFKILYNLKMIINGSRSAEKTFLASTGIDLSQGATAKKLFENFNLILGSEEVFKRNLALIQQLSKDKTTTLIDPSKNFYSYLKTAIKEYGIKDNFNIRKSTKKQFEDFVDKVIGIALERTYANFKEYKDKNGNWKTQIGATKESRTYYNAYMEIVETIRKLQNTGIFYKYSHLFKITKLLEESANSAGDIVGSPKISKSSFDNGGTVLEFIEQTVFTEIRKFNLTNTSSSGSLHIVSEQTGGAEYNQQKSDVTVGYATGKVDFSSMKQSFANRNRDNSTRVQNIEALDNYLNTVSNAMNSIVFISDKNYTIKAGWKGVKAQEAMTLTNAKVMLESFGVDGVEALINFLANCGPDMIQGVSNSQVEMALAAQIGYYLFDHLEITGSMTANTNVVNVMNVNNMYIPLSVFLESVYNSLKANLDNLENGSITSLVNVHITYGGDDPSSEWTVNTWAKFRTSREEKTKIQYKILKDIESFIMEMI